ncbi:MAG TPA: efflux transporter outer membrane subunit [Terriglobia bacterium]|nr:efflux transporter outer membrane subunit [Terriglobia bacterium]
MPTAVCRLHYAHCSLPAAYCLLPIAFCLLFTACMVGPNYQRPSASVPAAFKEPPTDNADEINRWKPAQPNEEAARGKWWEIYNEPDLNALEEQVNISNQNVLLAEAQFREAADAVRIARSALYPTITTAPSYARSEQSGTLYNVSAGNLTGGQRNIFALPFSLSYTVDLWGSIRRNVRAGVATAQATFAQLQNARLSYQVALAEDYFELQGTDGAEQLLQTTVKSYQDYLKLTQDRFSAGVASGADVAQAQTQVKTAQAQLIDYGVARAQLEHAIAVLTGKPPAEVSITQSAIKIVPPPVPVGVPSTLLERRPDIAAAEREMASENEQIGIAKAAYYPSLTLNASGGFEGGQAYNFLTWPARFWSIGPTFNYTIFDAGRRRAQVELARNAYDATVANYRQTVLTGFQQVEDNLAALRVLENEAAAEDEAVRAAQDALNISTYQYKAGTVDYLTVITEQAILLNDQVQAVNILTRRMTASALLVEALGGGWNSSTLPTANDLEHGK